eukprot:12412733-Prorocentrum_lima.AAC.1
MTSSLVGSEMCIRDSRALWPIMFAWKEPKPFDQFDAIIKSNMQEYRGSVSYTHLTLPTICSV